MEKFCKECGGLITDSSLKFCQHCGHELKKTTKQQDKQSTNSPTKQPKQYTKKQKVMFSTIATLLVIIAGFYMWGKNYYSPQSTVKRFVTAITEDDSKVIQSLAVVKGNSITEAEAKAFITLAKEEPNYINFETNNMNEFSRSNDLFKLVQNEKAFGIFDRYQISLVPQYALLELPFENVKSTFNEAELPIYEESEWEITYGPIAPGKYNIKNSFSGEFAEVESDETIILADSDSDEVYHMVELEGDTVTFDLYNRNGVPIENAYLKVNDEKIAFTDNLRMERFGPLKLDGSVKVTPVIETQWGEIEAEEITIKDNYYDIDVNTVTDELMNQLADAILLYGEDYVKAHAAYNVDLFTNITEEMRDGFQSNFDSFVSRNDFFSGRIDSIEINFDELYYEDDTVTVPTKFYFTSDFHLLDEKADLDERIDYTRVEAIYDSEEEKWLINDSPSISGWYSDSFKATKTLEGSKEIHNASKPASASTDDEDPDLESKVEDVTIDYIYGLVDAINASDYELVRPYIKDGSNLNNMQSDLVEYYEDINITQEVISAEVTDVSEDGDNWVVTTNETIKLIYDSGEEETKDYVWNYSVEKDGNDVALTDIWD